jgi:hypothetical protein
MREVNLAYVAGFLDGDGAIMAEIEKRQDLREGIRIRIVVQFSQKTTHEFVLEHIQNILDNIGNIHRDNKSGSSLRIKNQEKAQQVLQDLMPFVVAKREQISLALKLLASKATAEKIALANQISANNVKSRRAQTSTIPL